MRSGELSPKVAPHLLSANFIMCPANVSAHVGAGTPGVSVVTVGMSIAGGSMVPSSHVN